MTENRALPESWHNHDGYRAIFNAALTGICANPAFFGAIYQGSPAGAVKFASDVLAAALTFTASLSDASPKPSSDEQET